MKAGLFICDHVNESVRDRFGDYADMFSQLFPELDWTYYEATQGEFPKDLNECDVYFATGSRRSVYEPEPWIDEAKEIIRQIATTHKYFVGFCFGHQLLGEAMGGKVQQSPNGWCVGVHTFEITEKASWMKPFQQPINLLMMCRDQVLSLPPGATVLASSELCPVGIMRIGSKMLGIQAHPEFSKSYDQYLMTLRLDKIGKEVVEAGIRSLALDVHRAAIRNWVLGFIGMRL
jgi:GMP synthase-like glutamine amidotransferase